LPGGRSKLSRSEEGISLPDLSDLGTEAFHDSYVSDTKSYSSRVLRAKLGRDDPILIHGGGNLGDLWPRHQQLREQVIRDFPNRPILQLPQSIHFGDRSGLERAKRVFEGHPNLHSEMVGTMQEAGAPASCVLPLADSRTGWPGPSSSTSSGKRSNQIGSA
jgi:Polysaccharide pyruvyl transferase